MATKVAVKTTFEPSRAIEPTYTGGDVSIDVGGHVFAACVEEDVLIVDVETTQPLVRIEGDGEPITSLCISPLASHVIVCSRSLSMRVFALRHEDLNGSKKLVAELLRSMKPHASPVVTTAIDNTGTLLATGAADGSVKVWDIRGGFVTHTFHGHGGVISALEFFQKSMSTREEGLTKNTRKGKRKSRDGEDTEMVDGGVSNGSETTFCLASGAEDGMIRIWNLHTSKSIKILESHVSVVRSLDFSSERNALLSASRDKTIIIWDAQTWKSSKVIPVLETVEAAGFTTDGEFCFSGGEYGVVRIWHTATGREITEEQEQGSESDAIVSVLKLAKTSLISIHVDQTFRTYSLEPLNDITADKTVPSLPITHRLSGNHDEIIDMACVGPDRSMLALATNTESIRIISINSQRSSSKKATSPLQFGAEVALLSGHDDIIICLDVDWSGNWLATGAKDNSARLWRLDPSTMSFTCFAVLVGHAESIGAIALPRSPPPAGSAGYKDPLSHPPSFLITGSQDRTIKRWDLSKFKVDQSSMNDPHTGAKALYTRVAHEKDINAIDVSSNSSLFASASQDRTVKIWSVEDGSVAGILRGHKRGVWSIRFAPSDAPPLTTSEGSNSKGLLLSGSGDRTVKIWSLSTYTCLRTFEGHSNSVLKVVWLAAPKPSSDEGSSRDEHTRHPIIASASSDTLIKLWNPYTPPSANSDPLLTTLDNHTDRVWALVAPPPPFPSSSSSSPSPIRYPLISGAADATLTFWNDTTALTTSTATAAASMRIEQDQALQNHLRARNYREVIVLALQLNHPARLLSLFETVLATPAAEREAGTLTGVAAVDDVLGSLSHEQLWLLLQRVRDWNTNARTASVAQRVLYVVLKKYPGAVLVEMAGRKKGGMGRGMRDLLRALEVYTERHYRRTEEMIDESFLVEYTLGQMDEVAGVAVNGDVVMS